MAHLEKEYMVEEITNRFKNSSGLIVANFEKVGVVDIDSLRRKLEKNSSGLIVTKNTLIKKALSALQWDDVKQYIHGATGIAVYNDDPVAVAKTLFDFSKDHETFKVRGGLVDGQVVNEEKTKELSDLPSKNVLLATVVNRMKSPIAGFVNVLSGPIRGFVNVLNQINKKKD
ncbi:MAG: 50S ribosomal protein L10 [Candidatus Omnitrophica bacterium]|nr:50S ribosomal protein L10 [Candidatus Omnitrophota bacterium]